MARILTESQNWVAKCTTTQATCNETPEKSTDFKNSTSTHNAAIMYVQILWTLCKEHIINWTHKIRFVVVRDGSFMPLLIYVQPFWACHNMLWHTVEAVASFQTSGYFSQSTRRPIQQGCHILTVLHIFTNGSLTQSDIAEIRQRILLFEKEMTCALPYSHLRLLWRLQQTATFFFSFLSLRKAYVKESQKISCSHFNKLTYLRVQLCLLITFGLEKQLHRFSGVPSRWTVLY
jgi:hypothetical protein